MLSKLRTLYVMGQVAWFRLWTWLWPRDASQPRGGPRRALGGDRRESPLSIRRLEPRRVLAVVVDAGSNQNVDEGETVTLTASFTDTDGDTHTATIDWGDGFVENLTGADLTEPAGGAAGSIMRTHEYADEGSYQVSVTVTDAMNGSDNDADTMRFFVANVNPTVAINGAPATSPEGTTINLTSTVTDPGSGDTLTYAWTVEKNGSAFASGNTANFSFTPDDNGTYAVMLEVEDGDAGAGTDTASVTVVNVAPTVTINGAPANSNEGTAINLTSTVTDPGGADTFTYSWEVSKNGAAYDSGAGLSFSFTPDDNGTYVVSLTVTDDNGGIGSDMETVTVSNVAPAVTINGAPANSTEGAALSLTSTVTDPGSADTLTYDWQVTKDGAAFASGALSSFNFVPDDNGTYVVTLTVTDDDGGVDSDMRTIIVANVVPTVTINGAPGSVDEGTPVNLTSTVIDLGAADTLTYDWQVTKNGAAFASGATSTFSFTPDDNGSYVVTLTVTDDDGGAGSDMATVTATNVAPTVTINGAPANSDEGTTINLTSTVTDPSAGSGTFTYDWSVEKDGVAFASGSTANFSFTPNDNGTYVVTLTVEDDDGGDGVAMATIVVANVAPTVVINGAPGNIDEGTPVALTSTVTDPGAADTLTYDWQVTKDGVAYSSGAASTFNLTPDDNGTYVVTLTVTDDDGGSDTDMVTIAVANVSPTVTINGAPATSPEGLPIGLTSGVVDPGTADTFIYQWEVFKDGVSYAAGAAANFNFVPDDNATYVVTLTVTDDDGGFDSDSQTILVENVAPNVTINGAPANSDEGSPLNLTSMVVDPGVVDTLTYDWQVTRNGVFFTSSAATNLSFTPGDDATYVITLTVTDDDGGVGSDIRTVVVDNVAPTVTINGAPVSSPEGTSINLTSTVTDPGFADGPFAYDWQVTRNGALFASGNAAAFSFTPDDNGTYEVTLVVTDKDLGTGTAMASITVTNVAPTVAILNAPLAPVPEGTTVLLSSSTFDPGAADTLTYSWQATRNGMAYASGNLSTFDLLVDDDGTYEVTLVVSDDDGGLGNAMVTIVVTNVAPTVTIGGVPGTVNEGTTVNLTSIVTDPGAGDVFTYGWQVTRNGLLFDSGNMSTFSFSPNDNGSYVVTLSVNDGDGGVGMDSRTIVVQNVAPTATINGAPMTSNEGAPISLTSSVSDPGINDTFSYSWIVTRNGVVETIALTPDLTFTPADNALYEVTLNIFDDDFGVGTDSVSITVQNVAPTVTLAGGPLIADEGALINFTSSVTDPGVLDVVFTYTWTVTRNGSPYLQGFTPFATFVAGDNGNYVVTITATDKDGGTGTAMESLVVNNVAPTVSVSGAPALGVEGAMISMTSAVFDPGIDDIAFSYNWQVLRNGLLVSSSTSPTMSYVPADNGVYEVMLSVTDKDGGAGMGSSMTTVTNVSPTFVVLMASDLSAVGETTVTIKFLDPGSADTFDIVVDWRDGSVDRFPGSGRFSTTGPLQFSHLYVRNPDPTNPAAPIPIQVTVNDDDSGSAEGVAVATVPGTGISSLAVLQTSGPQPFLFALPPTLPAAAEMESSAPASQSAELGSTSQSAVNASESRVVLRQVLPSGDEVEVDALDDEQFDNVLKLLRRLPDDHYRVYLIGANGVERLIFDVLVRQGKLADPSEESEGLRRWQPAEAVPPADAESNEVPEGTETQQEDALPEPPPDASRPGGEPVFGSREFRLDAEPAGVGSAFARSGFRAGAVLVDGMRQDAARQSADWAELVDGAMEQFQPPAR